MKTFVKESRISMMSTGWGNGYVIIPQGHPMHGKDYNEIEVDVHAGLTFGTMAKDLDWPEIPEDAKDGYVVGFDTAHYGDDISRWPKSEVEAEAKRLAEQLEALAL